MKWKDLSAAQAQKRKGLGVEGLGGRVAARGMITLDLQEVLVAAESVGQG